MTGRSNSQPDSVRRSLIGLLVRGVTTSPLVSHSMAISRDPRACWTSGIRTGKRIRITSNYEVPFDWNLRTSRPSNTPSMNLVFTKLIEFASPQAKDRKDSVVIASTAMAELIQHAVTDLKKCLLFHEHVVSDNVHERSYLGTKVDVLKQRIESMPKLQKQ